MADKQVETKVVQVKFDNSKFSKKIDKTIKQCEKFDKSLQFKGSKDNIKEIQKALDGVELKQLNKELDETEGTLHKITIGFKDIIKIKLISRAIDTVITKTNAMIKSMLGINNVIAGWQQYETQMTNVGGILNQVKSKGYELSDVADAMDRLRWYTDETSYSFTTLSNGIRQFVIAGVDLNKAAEAAMGVTNLAGSAKVFDEYKIQSAMDAVSKAMQTGYMDTMKWTSLTNTAGIVTEEFSQKLLEEAAAQGKLIKSAGGYYKTKKSGKTVTTENIRSTLSDRWLTSDILANVMDEYASASTAVETFSGLMAEQTDENLAKINKMFEESKIQFKSFDELLSSTYEDEEGNVVSVFESAEAAAEMTARQTGLALEKLGYKFDEVSYKAFKSAQETTSFSQAITYVKKAISTQWSNIFETIFGDYQTATNLWSDVSDKFYDSFVSPFEGLAEKFSAWSKLEEGGAKDFRKTILTIIDIIGQFKTAISSGFRAVFGSVDESWLQKVTIALKNFFDKIAYGFRVIKDEEGNIKEEGPLFKMVKALSKILAFDFKIIGKVSSIFFKFLDKALTALEPVFEVVIDVLDMVADGLIWVMDMIDELGILDYVVKGVAKALGWLATGIKKVVEWIKGKVDLEKVTNKLAKAFGYLKIAIEWIIDKFKQAGTAIKNWWNENEIAQKTLDFFKTAIEKTKSAFSGFKKSTDEAAEGVDNLGESLENTAESGEKYTNGKGWFIALKTVFVSIGKFFKDTFKTVAQFLQDKGVLDVLKKVFETLKGVLQPIIDLLVGVWKDFSKLAKEDPTAALEVIKKVIFTLLGIFLLLQITGIIKAGKDNLWAIYYALKAFKKRMLAERWKALASAILILSAAVLVLTFAMEKIGEIPTKKAWKAMGIVSAIFATFAILLAVINAPIFNVGLRTGLAVALQLEAFAIGIALFMRALNKALVMVKGNSQADIWKAYGLIAAISGLLVVIANSLFKKVKKEGLLKGEFVKGPGLIKLINLFLVVYGILKLTMWFIGKINEFEPDQLNLAGKVAIAIVAGIAVIMGAIRLLGLITSRKTGVEKITHQWIKVNIGSLALVALAAYYVISQTKDMTLPEIGHGALTLLAIFGAISMVLVALGVMDRIASGKNAEKVGVKISKAMLSISLSVLLCVAAFKMIDKEVSIPKIWSSAGVILALYGLIGGIAIALTAVSKVVSLVIGKKGVEKIGAKSPIGGVLIAIAGLVLSCVLTMKLLNQMTWDEFKENLMKLAWVIGIVAVTAITIMIASHFANGKNIIIAMASIAVAILAVAYAIVTIAELVSKDAEAFDTAAWTVGLIALALAAIVAILIIIASKNKTAIAIWPTLLAAAALFLSIGGAILMIAKAIQMIAEVPEEGLERAKGVLQNIIIAMAVIVGGIVWLVSKTAGIGAAAIGAAAGMLLAMALAVIGFAYAIKILENMDIDKMDKAFNTLIGLIITFTAAMIFLGALGYAGVGEIGAGLMLAIGGAALMLSGAVLILSVAIEKITESIIKLMNETTPEKCNNLRDLGKSLGTLAAGTIANGLANLGASVANLGASMADFYGTVFKFGTGIIKKVGEFLGFDMRSNDEKEIDILNQKANAVEKYANALTKMREIDENMITDKINKISSAIIKASVGLIGSESMSFFNSKEKIGFAAFLENLEKLKEMLEDMPDPVITPVLDLTEFRKGMYAIQNGTYNIRGKLYNDYAPVANMPSMSSIRSQGGSTENTATANGVGNNAEAITINQEFILNDALAYSYDTQRATANAIAKGTKMLMTK